MCCSFCIITFSLCVLPNYDTADKKANYPIKVSGIDISPFPISRDVETTFAINAAMDAGEAISSGKLEIDVAYLGFYIHSENHDLCKKTKCPISDGNITITHKQALPGITPPGSYTLKMTLTGANKKELTCITFDFSMGFIAAEGLAEA